MDEKDLNNINMIDMECSNVDDDDFVVRDFNTLSSDDGSEDRSLNSKTGIIIDLSDDCDTDIKNRVITANINKDNNQINVDANFNLFNDEIRDYNSIDMETEYFDDEDEDLLNNKTLIDEDIMIDEKKAKNKSITGEVEDDYWEKISAAHNKSNKKGAYNAHFHLVGNPEKEIEFFNNSIGLSSPINSNIASTSSVGDISVSSGESFCENLDNNYTQDFNNLLSILGFEAIKNSDNSYTVLDLCDINPDTECKDMKELILVLNPYIEDCLIYPLQYMTGENFKTCKEWCDWYTDEKASEFPKCADDIKYCDLVANHLDECNI